VCDTSHLLTCTRILSHLSDLHNHKEALVDRFLDARDQEGKWRRTSAKRKRFNDMLKTICLGSFKEVDSLGDNALPVPGTEDPAAIEAPLTEKDKTDHWRLYSQHNIVGMLFNTQALIGYHLGRVLFHVRIHFP
jgi:hypothetical protein